ncbi:hypothetical protein PG985_016327 [Apiospora marii]|uniref:uncharacterized protein n=1 Tax=Apiospora marii TaxID=335849 RepID=UPI003130AF1C
MRLRPGLARISKRCLSRLIGSVLGLPCHRNCRSKQNADSSRAALVPSTNEQWVIPKPMEPLQPNTGASVPCVRCHLFAPFILYDPRGTVGWMRNQVFGLPQKAGPAAEFQLFLVTSGTTPPGAKAPSSVANKAAHVRLCKPRYAAIRNGPANSPASNPASLGLGSNVNTDCGNYARPLFLPSLVYARAELQLAMTAGGSQKGEGHTPTAQAVGGSQASSDGLAPLTAKRRGSIHVPPLVTTSMSPSKPAGSHALHRVQDVAPDSSVVKQGFWPGSNQSDSDDDEYGASQHRAQRNLGSKSGKLVQTILKSLGQPSSKKQSWGGYQRSGIQPNTQASKPRCGSSHASKP